MKRIGLALAVASVFPLVRFVMDAIKGKNEKNKTKSADKRADLNKLISDEQKATGSGESIEEKVLNKLLEKEVGSQSQSHAKVRRDRRQSVAAKQRERKMNRRQMKRRSNVAE